MRDDDDAGPRLDAAEMDRREAVMKSDGLLVGIAGLALLNGMHFSPFFDPFFIVLRPIAQGFFITSPLLMFYFTSLILSTAVLVVTGVPAAIFERVTGRKRSDAWSLGIWFGGLLMLSVPTLLNSTGAG